MPKIIQNESLIHSKNAEIVQRDQVNTPGGYKQYLTTQKTGEVPVRPWLMPLWIYVKSKTRLSIYFFIPPNLKNAVERRKDYFLNITVKISF